MNRLHYLQVCCAVSFSAISSGTTLAKEHDPELQKRFLQGIKQAANNLEQLSYRAKFKIESKTNYSKELLARFANKGVEPEKNSSREFDVSLRGSLILERSQTESDSNLFKVRNDSYAFSLEQSSGVEQASLRFLEQLGIDREIDTRITELIEGPSSLTNAAYSLWEYPLIHLVEDGSFSIKRVSAAEPKDENSELVRVEFECLVDDPTRNIKFRVNDGFLICNPSQQWALIEYGGTRHTYRNEDLFIQHATLTVDETISEIPVATKVKFTNIFPNDPGTTISIDISSSITARDVPEEEFYLTYYGLQEPNFNESWFSISAGYLLGGIGCVLVGVIIQKRRH